MTPPVYIMVIGFFSIPPNLYYAPLTLVVILSELSSDHSIWWWEVACQCCKNKCFFGYAPVKTT